MISSNSDESCSSAWFTNKRIDRNGWSRGTRASGLSYSPIGKLGYTFSLYKLFSHAMLRA
jgi:hypothetical protein